MYKIVFVVCAITASQAFVVGNCPSACAPVAPVCPSDCSSPSVICVPTGNAPAPAQNTDLLSLLLGGVNSGGPNSLLTLSILNKLLSLTLLGGAPSPAPGANNTTPVPPVPGLLGGLPLGGAPAPGSLLSLSVANLLGLDLLGGSAPAAGGLSPLLLQLLLNNANNKPATNGPCPAGSVPVAIQTVPVPVPVQVPVQQQTYCQDPCFSNYISNC